MDAMHRRDAGCGAQLSRDHWSNGAGPRPNGGLLPGPRPPVRRACFALESARPLVRVINSHRRAIDLVSAGVLLVMGVLLLTNKLTILSTGITQLVPSWPSPAL